MDSTSKAPVMRKAFSCHKYIFLGIILEFLRKSYKSHFEILQIARCSKHSRCSISHKYRLDFIELVWLYLYHLVIVYNLIVIHSLRSCWTWHWSNRVITLFPMPHYRSNPRVWVKSISLYSHQIIGNTNRVHISWLVLELGYYSHHAYILQDQNQNESDFPRPVLLGVWDGFWWAIVSASTVG